MRDLYRGSSTLALRPRLQHLKDFHYKLIPLDHLVPQHLQGVPTRTLGLSSPEHTASPLAHRGRTSNTEFTLEPETTANTHVHLLKVQDVTLVITTL